MNRKILLCMMALAFIFLAGCSQQQSQMSYIGAETAKQTALEAAALSEQEVSSISTDMSTRDGLDYYRVRFEASGQTYQYDVDALTGVVISAHPSSSTPSSQTNQLEMGDQQGGDHSDSAASSFQQSLETAAPATSSTDASACIGEDEAKRIALEHAGLDESQVTFVCAFLEFDDRQWEYEVEFYTQNYEEYDYEIDAYTGAIISFDYDAEYYSSQQGSSSAITAEQAQQLALAQVPGASESDIRKFKTDHDDGILLYEGEIIYDGMEYEFEIDAYSGFIREWSAEPFAR